MTPAEKQAARDKIAALRTRCVRAEHGTSNRELEVAGYAYISALERLCDELTAPEPEDLTRDLEASITQVQVGKACGVTQRVRNRRVER